MGWICFLKDRVWWQALVNRSINIGYEVLTLVVIKSSVFWDITLDYIAFIPEIIIIHVNKPMDSMKGREFPQQLNDSYFPKDSASWY
jgi:hypothetical protein